MKKEYICTCKGIEKHTKGTEKMSDERKAGRVRVLSKDTTENPKLLAKTLATGRESLFLEYYLGYSMEMGTDGRERARKERRREYLSLYLWQAPRTAQERQQNKDTMELAKRIRFERGQELLQEAEGYRLRKTKAVDFLEYYRDYMAAYTKADFRMIEIAYRRFVDFLEASQKYARYAAGLRADRMDGDMMADFAEYLKPRSRGEGAKSIFQRFKKVVKHAVDHDVMAKDPCRGVTIKADENILRKDVLSLDEIQRLLSTHYKDESQEIRRAFTFCLYTGLRWCDVKALTFASVDYSNRLLRFEQRKTSGHSTASGVVIPLGDGLLSLIGKGGRDEAVFKLPSYEASSKAVRRWVERAGIDKHISWHCARHSFAVNILNNGANIKTVSSLLGHSSLKHTEKYTRAVDSLKRAAIDSLPELKEG